MTFPILGGNGAGEAGYQIDNSLRFNDDDTARLTRTPSANGNQKTFTTSFWVKKGNISDCTIFSFGTGTTYNISVVESGSEFFLATTQVGVTQVWSGKSEGKYRDVSAWYHVVIAIDTTQATSSNRVKAYINGNFVSNQSGFTYPSQNYNAIQNPQTTWAVGSRYDGNNPADMYLAEIHHIDGQALSPTDFGEFDEDSGIWKPIEYTGSYGTNGFYLDFEDSAALGDDVSGNGNNFTPTNLASTDQTTDTPTNNFATFNAVFRNNTTNFTQPATLSEGNLRATGVNTEGNISTIGLNAGKWYWEAKIVTKVSNDLNFNILSIAGGGGAVFRSVTWQSQGDLYIDDSLYDTSFTTFTSGDIIACALDLDAATPAFKLYKNGAEQGGGFTFNASGRDDNGASIYIGVGIENTSDDAQYNFGNPTFTISSGNSDDNGYGNFEYAPPSGYLALCTQNLATELSPTIDDGSQYFNTVLYTGTGTTQSITGVGFQPDFVWLKDRDVTYDYQLHDSTRGASAGYLASNNFNPENATYPLTSFDSDGWTTVSGGTPGQNASGDTFVSWNWLANGGTTSSNTDGSITATVQVNTTAGFSIATYSGTGSAGSVGHGLGVAPKFVIPKCRNVNQGWASWHPGLSGSGYIIELNESNAEFNNGTSSYTAFPTSSVVNLGTDNSVSGRDYVMYCFAEIEGYSKFGSYTGNGSSDGTFVYTGFRPAFLMIKRSDGVTNWAIWDNKRDTYNEMYHMLQPNVTGLEITDANPHIDYTSNGFKFRTSWAGQNASSGKYIYIAFAENPFVSSAGIPVVAR